MVRVGIPCKSWNESSTVSSTRPEIVSRHSSRGMSIETGPFERMKKRSLGVRRPSTSSSGGEVGRPKWDKFRVLPQTSQNLLWSWRGLLAGVASCANVDSRKIEAITGAEKPAAANRPTSRRRDRARSDDIAGRRTTVIGSYLPGDRRILGTELG